MPRKVRGSAEKAPDVLRRLWLEGFFTSQKSQKMIDDHLTKLGTNFRTGTLRMALVRSDFLIPRTRDGVVEYVQKRPAISKEVDRVGHQLFDDALIRGLGGAFKAEIADLHHNFGVSGNCTAFLLRKILEKLIYITFGKHGVSSKLEDKNEPGKIVGLGSMIHAAAREKVNGIPLLTSQTAEAIRGIKFLGDASAHNPLTQVDMKTIIPQMPFIITAYKELLR